MHYDNKFESNISVVNVSYFIPLESRKELEQALSSHEIGLLFYEQRQNSIQASLFQTIIVYVNEHLTELLIYGILAPTAYDTLKKAIHFVAKSISGFIRKRDKDETDPSMKFKIGNAEVIAPIPSNLSDEQFSSYMDTLKNTLKRLSDNEARKVERYDRFIVEYDRKTENLYIKTVSQYGSERAAEQRRAKGDKHD